VLAIPFSCLLQLCRLQRQFPTGRRRYRMFSIQPPAEQKCPGTVSYPTFPEGNCQPNAFPFNKLN
jgi:hypothetical protein